MLHRVAAHFGERDIGAFVDSVAPDQLTKWLALAWHDGWGESWSMASMIAVVIHNALMRILHFLGGEVKKKDFVTLDTFEPNVRTGRKMRRYKPMPVEEGIAHPRMAGLK